MNVYHIDHSSGPGWTAEGDGALAARTKATAVPQLSYDEYRKFAMQMRQEGRPIIFNNEDWGLAEVELPEFAVSADKLASKV